jgi:hypothetical protein
LKYEKEGIILTQKDGLKKNRINLGLRPNWSIGAME